MIKDLIKKTTIANVVAGAVIIAAVVYAIIYRDTEMIKNLALVSSGWLFGVTATGLKGSKE